MSVIKVPALRPGDLIGLISPAGVVKAEQVEESLNILRGQGFKYRLGPHAFSENGLTSATVRQRVNDLVTFVKDPRIKVIWSLRGGYGSIQLLKRIDYTILEKHPKLLIGFSDITALQWGIYQRTGLPALSGLTLTLQVTENNPYLPASLKILSGKKTTISEENLNPGEIAVYRAGNARGILMGGTLSMICSLCGTPYWLERENLILFIEDVNEPLYRIDRYLQQLSLMSFWKRVKGVILGQFLYQGENLDVVPLILPHLLSSVPVIYNFPYGHMEQCFSLPMGVKAKLQASPFELSWTPFLRKK